MQANTQVSIQESEEIHTTRCSTIWHTQALYLSLFSRHFINFFIRLLLLYIYFSLSLFIDDSLSLVHLLSSLCIQLCRRIYFSLSLSLFSYHWYFSYVTNSTLEFKAFFVKNTLDAIFWQNFQTVQNTFGLYVFIIIFYICSV